MNEWEKAVVKAMDRIEENLTHEISLADLAAQAGYSPFYFSRLFRLITGVTLKKYIADRRLHNAALEIRDTRTRIIDIAVKYGFSSQEALTRAFSSAYGVPPYAFRKRPASVNLTDSRPEFFPFNNLKKGEEEMNDSKKTGGAVMRLAAINIVSANPKGLAGFYERVLGAETDYSHGGPHRIEAWFGKRNAVAIVFNCDEGFQPQTYNACQGFELHVDDADAEYERIRGLGVEVKEPPKDLPWGFRYFHIKDPDGNGIDIVVKL